MPTPTNGVLDDFNRTNEGPPPNDNGDWRSGPMLWDDLGGVFGWRTASNRCQQNGGNGLYGDAAWATEMGTHHEVFYTIITLQGSGLETIYAIVRASDDTG